VNLRQNSTCSGVFSVAAVIVGGDDRTPVTGWVRPQCRVTIDSTADATGITCIAYPTIAQYIFYCKMAVHRSVLLLACLMGQYCFARRRLSSSSVTLPAGGRAGRRARRRLAATRPAAWAVGRPTLHGGPVWLHPVRATPCSICSSK